MTQHGLDTTTSNRGSVMRDARTKVSRKVNTR